MMPTRLSHSINEGRSHQGGSEARKGNERQKLGFSTDKEITTQPRGAQHWDAYPKGRIN